MPLSAGTRLGPHEIIAPVGQGGMGEVYRAHDSRLKRDVAIKVLPSHFAADEERLARFTREAQVLAALNHPNIAAIYGIEEAGDIRAIVMEFVDGVTLAQRLERGPIALEEALPIARQIAEALEVAHEKGIIHRDLKPANIALTADGQVKVLDFGLAKALEPEAASDVSNSPTLTMRATQAGLILGTAAYMSPEQARGRAADKRSDVWAFGCVLFEMLTGKRAFDGEDVTDIIAAVVRGEPDWHALPAGAPPQITLLITRCIVKDRKHRISDIAVARFLLNESLPVAPVGEQVAPIPPPPATSRKRIAVIAVTTFLVGAAMTAIGIWGAARLATPSSPQPMRFTVALAQPLVAQGIDRDIAISPSATHIVYRGGSGQGLLFVRPIDQLDAQPLPSTTGARQPFFSPDGKWIGFFAGQDLKKVSITGGPAITLCRFTGPPRVATWAADDTITFGTQDPGSGLLRVPAGGGQPTVATTRDEASNEGDHFYPSALPSGRGTLYTVAAAQLDDSQVAVLDAQTNQSKILIRGGSDATYLASGHLIYAAAGSLRAVRFDLDRLEVTSDPIPVIDQVSTSSVGMANYAVAPNGALIYVPGAVGASGPQRSLVWVNRQGREEPLKAPLRAYTIPRISPDGSRIAIEIRDQEQDIWVWDVARHGPLTRLTFDPGSDQFPVWTPDSRRVVFSSTRGGVPNIYRQSADGTGAVERLTEGSQAQFPHSMSPDGTGLALFQANTKTGNDVVLLALPRSTSDARTPSSPPATKPNQDVQPLVATPFLEWLGEISPDGRWIAYASNESGAFEVYVRPFPNVDAGRWQVSIGGGTKPAWGRNARELFYLDANGNLLSAPVQTTGSTFNVIGNPAKLFDARYFLGPPPVRPYDVHPDGQRFLMIKDNTSTDSNAPLNIVVVLNWFEELKQRSQ